MDQPRKLDASPFVAAADREWNPARALDLFDGGALADLQDMDNIVDPGFIVAGQGVQPAADAGATARRVNRLRSSYA